MPDAPTAFAGPALYAANIMTQPGETAEFTLSGLAVHDVGAEVWRPAR